MRKTLFFVLLLSLTAAWFIGCSDSAKKTPVVVLPNIAFLRGPSDGTGMLTPMLGTFSSTGAFTETTAVDTTTNQPVTAEINSIILSPDQTKAVLELYGGLDGNSGQWDIWIANSDLSANPVQITNDAYFDVEPQFSPDGTKIVYASERPIPGETSTDCSVASCQWQIVVRNATAGGTELILPIPVGIEYQMAPTFSPDGTKIAMMADGYFNDIPFAGILATNADGSNPQALSNPLYSDACYYCQDELPTYSADGSKIIFDRDDWNGATEFEDIYSMSAVDGSGVTLLTDSVGLNSDPLTVNISGIGERILFNSNRDNLSVTTGDGFCIYSIKSDGTGITRLTNNTQFDGFSTWWYDGPNTPVAAARHSRGLHGRHIPFPKGHTPVHGWHQ